MSSEHNSASSNSAPGSNSPKNSVFITGEREVFAALNSPGLVPPPREFADGATAHLRDEMARFTTDDRHSARRQSVVELLATIDEVDLFATAKRLTAAELKGVPISIVSSQQGLAYRLPSYVLATLLGHSSEAEEIRADVESVARVIGRGEPVSRRSDEAAARLLERFETFPDPVAVVSVLYQNHDATAGLLAGTVLAEFEGIERSTDGFQTVRVAQAPVAIGDTKLQTGQRVSIDLSAPDHEFGVGPHSCPGELVARAVVTGAMEELMRSGYSLDQEKTVLNEFGRPTVLVLKP